MKFLGTQIYIFPTSGSMAFEFSNKVVIIKTNIQQLIL